MPSAKRLCMVEKSEPTVNEGSGGGGVGSNKPRCAGGESRGLLEKLGAGRQLRCIIVGHNPSQQAWQTGHYYAHPSNVMWRILRETGLAPVHLIRGCVDDDLMPDKVGIGFTDLGTGIPGTESSKFKSAELQKWGLGFCTRLKKHVESCGAPGIIAFSGKRQFVELFEKHERPSKVEVGPQGILPRALQTVLPPSTQVWVMTSTSGAAAMTREARYAPWRLLANELEKSHPLSHCSFT